MSDRSADWIEESLQDPEVKAAYEGERAHLKEQEKLLARIAELEAKLNTPELHDFAKAVALEAAHQRERWGEQHDAQKSDADWFWLIGYLAGKALFNPGDDADKRLHRIITVAAAAANWHDARDSAATPVARR